MKTITIRIGAQHNDVTIGTKTFDLGAGDRATRAKTRAFIVREWKRGVRNEP